MILCLQLVDDCLSLLKRCAFDRHPIFIRMNVAHLIFWYRRENVSFKATLNPNKASENVFSSNRFRKLIIVKIGLSITSSFMGFLCVCMYLMASFIRFYLIWRIHVCTEYITKNLMKCMLDMLKNRNDSRCAGNYMKQRTIRSHCYTKTSS